MSRDSSPLSLHSRVVRQNNDHIKQAEKGSFALMYFIFSNVFYCKILLLQNFTLIYLLQCFGATIRIDCIKFGQFQHRPYSRSVGPREDQPNGNDRNSNYRSQQCHFPRGSIGHCIVMLFMQKEVSTSNLYKISPIVFFLYKFYFKILKKNPTWSQNFLNVHFIILECTIKWFTHF